MHIPIGVGVGWVEMKMNVTGFEAILRISVAKLVIGFFPLLRNLTHFVDWFLRGGAGGSIVLKKRTDRQYEVKRL